MRSGRAATERGGTTRLSQSCGTSAGTGQDSGYLARRVAAREQKQKRHARAKCRRCALVTSHRAQCGAELDPGELASRKTFAVQAGRRPAVVEVSTQRQPKAV